MEVDGRITKNFTLKEMANNQAKDYIKLKLTPETIEQALMMQELRDWAVITYPNDFLRNGLMVSSWYRTTSFNKSVGGASNSAHLDGRATDINNIPAKYYDAFTTAWQVICIKYGKIGGVVKYHWGMHFDSYSDKFGYKTFRTDDRR